MKTMNEIPESRWNPGEATLTTPIKHEKQVAKTTLTVANSPAYLAPPAPLNTLLYGDATSFLHTPWRTK